MSRRSCFCGPGRPGWLSCRITPDFWLLKMMMKRIVGKQGDKWRMSHLSGGSRMFQTKHFERKNMFNLLSISRHSNQLSFFCRRAFFWEKFQKIPDSSEVSDDFELFPINRNQYQNALLPKNHSSTINKTNKSPRCGREALF